MENSIDLLNQFETVKIKRRQLLPWWIKIFCWIFMVFGVAAIACLILGIFGFTTVLSFYGFETNDPLSLIGFLIISTAVLKAVAAFSLWFEKDYAIALGKIDAIIGIVLCSVSMMLPLILGNYGLKIRLELALLIPYLIRLNKIKADWESALHTDHKSLRWLPF